MDRERPRRRRRMFSLIEIMVVLLIIGLLTALVGPHAMRRLGKAKKEAAAAQIKLLINVCKDYYLDMDAYPDRLTDLVERPGGNDKWDGPYLDPPRLPLDPWGQDYQYELRQGNDTPLAITSYGQDGSPGGGDDISNVD